MRDKIFVSEFKSFSSIPEKIDLFGAFDKIQSGFYKSEIESMFNAGRGRTYLQPDVEGSIDINEMFDVSAYGGKDSTAPHVTKAFLKRVSDLNAG